MADLAFPCAFPFPRRLPLLAGLCGVRSEVAARHRPPRARGLLHRPMRPLPREAGRAGGILLRDPRPELPKSA